MVFLDTLWPDFDRRAPVAGDRDLRRARPPLRRCRRRCRRPSDSSAALACAEHRAGARAGGQPAAQSAQVPTISRVCRTSDEPVLGADLVGPALDRRALDLDRACRTPGRPGGGGARCCSGGRPPRRRRCAACRSRRRRPSPAACGRRWPGRPSAPCSRKRACRSWAEVKSSVSRAASRPRRAAGWGAVPSRRCSLRRSSRWASWRGGAPGSVCRRPRRRARRSGRRAARAGGRRAGSRRGPSCGIAGWPHPTRARARAARPPVVPGVQPAAQHRAVAALRQEERAIAISTMVPPEGVSA